MDDTRDRDADDGKDRLQSVGCDPVGWMTTDELEAELFNAIMADSSASSDDESEEFDEVDDYLDGDEEYEDEVEQRRSTLSLLATLRPRLAELLGGPPAESCGW
jgi:hypothetical protein